MKLVGSEEEENGITIVQLSRLMNCRKANERDEKKRSDLQTFSHVIIRTFMVDDIRQDNNLLWLTERGKKLCCFDTKITIFIYSHLTLRIIAKPRIENSLAVISVWKHMAAAVRMKLENRAEGKEFNRRV